MGLAVKLLGLGFEPKWGQSAYISKYLRVLSCNFTKTDKTEELAGLHRGREGVDVQKFSSRNVAGEITFVANPDDLGYWWRLALGLVSSSLVSGESLVYEHTFSPSDNPISATLALDEGVRAVRISGVKVNSLRLSSEVEPVQGAVSVTAKELGRGSIETFYNVPTNISYQFGLFNEILFNGVTSEATPASFTPSVGLKPFTFDQVQVKFGSTISEALLSASIPMDSWEVGYDNSLQPLPGINTQTIRGLKAGMPRVVGILKRFYASGDFEDYVTEETSKAMVLDFIGASIGNNSNYRLRLKLPRIKFMRSTKPYNAGQLLVETIDFNALYSKVESYLVEPILTNLQSNYN